MVTPVNTVDPQFQGNKEIEVAAGLVHATGSNVGSFSGDVRFGYYVLPRPSLGVHQSQTYHFIDDGGQTPGSLAPSRSSNTAAGTTRSVPASALSWAASTTTMKARARLAAGPRNADAGPDER